MKQIYAKALALTAFLAASLGANAATHHTIAGINPEDRSGWVVTGCSQQNIDAAPGNDGGLNHIIDDNVNTFWHTSWSGVVDNSTFPHYIIFDRGEEAPEIAAFSYTPRQGATNGNGYVTTYRLFATDEAPTSIPVSTGSQHCADASHSDAVAWFADHTPLMEGTFDIRYNDATTHGEHLAVLPETTSARYLIFVIDGASSSTAAKKFGNCAEFRTFQGVEDVEWVDPQDVLAGKQLKFENVLHTGSYLGVYSGDHSKMAPTTGADCVWQLIDNGDGTVKIFNEYEESYVGHLPDSDGVRVDLVKDEAEAGAWTVAWVDNVAMDQVTFSIGNAAHPALHMATWDGIVRWSLGVDASHFIPSVVEDEDYDGFAQQHIDSFTFSELIGQHAMTPEAAQAIEDVKNNPKDFSTYKALTAAYEAAPFNLPEAGKYYTLTSAQSGFEGKKMVEPYFADADGKLIVKVKDEDGVPALWQFTSCAEPDADLYVISAANTGKSLGRVTYGQATVMTEPGAEIEGHYDLINPNHASAEGASLVRYNDANRSDYSVARIKQDGSFDSYKDGLLPWKIEEVTEVTVAITEGFGTFHFPFAVTVPEGVELYTIASIENYKAALAPYSVSEVPANTPVIVASQAESVTFPIVAGSEVATEAEGALLLGSNAAFINEHAYVMHGNGFYPSDPYEGVPANSAYVIGDGDFDITITIPVSGISISSESETLEIGETVTLEATVAPENTTEPTAVTWTSSDEAVATVSAEGVVTAVAPGHAVITAACGGFSATCTITVNAPAPIPAESIVISEPSLSLKEGETSTLTATVLPEDADDKTVTWTSSNELVATVSADGVVIAIAEGTAIITATCGDASADCTVTVVKDEEQVSIAAIRANASAYEIYDLAGRRINTLPDSGVYIIKLAGRTLKITL